MKPDQYKEIMNKLDTDKGMDQRIKNTLIYSDYADGTQNKKDSGSYGKRNRKSFFRSFARINVMRPVFSSLVFLILTIIIIYGALKKQPDNRANPASGDGSTPVSSEDTAEVNTDAPEAYVPDSAAGSAAGGSGDVFESSSDAEAEIDAEAPAGTETLSDIWISHPPNIVTPGESIVLPFEAQIVTEEADKTANEKEGDFYFASFDVLTKDNVKASIPNLVIRLHGDVDTINPDDLTDIVLTRDSVPVENRISLTDRVEHFEWSYEDISDFYFKFDEEITEPGNYGMTGKYKGVPFTVYNKILEAAVTEEAADPDDLGSVSWAHLPDKDGSPLYVTELVFIFSGVQNSFYQSDLTDLKLTKNGQEISFAFTDQVFRYLEDNLHNSGDTSFNLIFKNNLSYSGTYVISGCYQGVPFTSSEITVP